MATPFQVCIGPGEDEYAAFYLNKDGNIQYSMSEYPLPRVTAVLLSDSALLTTTHLDYPNNKILKPVAHGWLVAAWKGKCGSDILKSRLVLGPDDTYLAVTPSAILHGEGLMPSLVKLLQAYEARIPSAPVITEAALGANGAWWVQFSDRTCQYDFAGAWPSLEALFRDGVVDERNINARLPPVFRHLNHNSGARGLTKADLNLCSLSFSLRKT